MQYIMKLRKLKTFSDMTFTSLPQSNIYFTG